MGVGPNGALDTPQTETAAEPRTKDGARVDVRRWKVISLLDAHISYRFWKVGAIFDVFFKDTHNINHETMSWKFRGTTDNYQPHPKVVRHLLETLEQYAETLPQDHVVRSIFRPTELPKLQMALHGRITIAGEGTFHGYSTFSVHANRVFGSVNKRSRFDLVEIAIPEVAGGGIANSPRLLRISPDVAVAKVLGIVTVTEQCNETCIMIVNFLRKVSSTDNDKKVLQSAANICRSFGNFYIGKAEPTWIAAYPLHTLKAPVLALPTYTDDTVYFVFPLQFISRDRWKEDPTSARPFGAVSGLMPIEPMIVTLEPEYTCEDSDDLVDSDAADELSEAETSSLASADIDYDDRIDLDFGSETAPRRC